MANHPARGRQAPLQIKRADGSWGEAPTLFAELGKDGFGISEAGRVSTRGIVAAAFTGCATRDESGRARTVIEFSGDDYNSWIDGRGTDDEVLRAFINPRTGGLRHDALREAAKLLLAGR